MFLFANASRYFCVHVLDLFFFVFGTMNSVFFFQALEAVKKQLRQSWVDSIKSNLATEVNALVQQWVSAECQKNFGKYRLDKE